MAAITQFKNEQLAIIGVASIFLLVFLLRRSGPTVSAEYLMERTFELDEIRAYNTTQHAWNLAKTYKALAPDHPHANIRNGADVIKTWKDVAPDAMLPGPEATETKKFIEDASAALKTQDLNKGAEIQFFDKYNKLQKDPAKKPEITDLKSH